MAASHGSCPSVVVCVVGLSRVNGDELHMHSGIGKSCLCFRFMYPGHDEYVNDHPSLLALHEFESPAINNAHFLYWGSTVQNYPIKGTVREQKIQYHVLEHTVFYQDVTSQPFTIITKPDHLDYYIRRITGQIESPGKVSYQTRDAICLPEEYDKQQYPSGISKLPRGFIVVIDVSQKGEAFAKQLARAEEVLSYLMKHHRKFIIVASKRDIRNGASLERVKELKRKYKTLVMETSATSNLNISDAFRLIAGKVLQKKVQCLSDHATTYEEAAHDLLTKKSHGRGTFTNFLRRRVQSSDERLYLIENSEEYKECVRMIGKYETDKIFAEHLVLARNREISTYAGVTENPDMRFEFLEEFVDSRRDLAVYTLTLRRRVEIIVEQHQSELTTGSTPRSTPDHSDPDLTPEIHPRNKEHTPMKTAHSQQTLDSGMHDTVTVLSHEVERRSTSYHSDTLEISSDDGYEDVDSPTYVNLPKTSATSTATPGDLTEQDEARNGVEAQATAYVNLERSQPQSDLGYRQQPEKPSQPEIDHETNGASEPTLEVSGQPNVQDQGATEGDVSSTISSIRDRVTLLGQSLGDAQVMTTKKSPPVRKKPVRVAPRPPKPVSPSSEHFQGCGPDAESPTLVSEGKRSTIQKRATLLQKLMSGEQQGSESEEDNDQSVQESPTEVWRKKPNISLKKPQEVGEKPPVFAKPPVSPKPPISSRMYENGKLIPQTSMEQEQPEKTSQVGQPVPLQLRSAPRSRPPRKDYEPKLHLIRKRVEDRKQKLVEPQEPLEMQTSEMSPPPIPPQKFEEDEFSPSIPFLPQPEPPPAHAKFSLIESMPQREVTSSAQKGLLPPPQLPTPAKSSILASNESEMPPPPIPQRTVDSFILVEANISSPSTPSTPKSASLGSLKSPSPPSTPIHGASSRDERSPPKEKGKDEVKPKKMKAFYEGVVLKVLDVIKSGPKEVREREKTPELEKKKKAATSQDSESDKRIKERKETAPMSEAFKVKPPTFINMKTRPLPIEPYREQFEADDTEHEPWDYEPIEFEHKMEDEVYSRTPIGAPTLKHSFIPADDNVTQTPPSSRAASVQRSQSFDSRALHHTGTSPFHSPSAAKKQQSPMLKRSARIDSDDSDYENPDLGPKAASESPKKSPNTIHRPLPPVPFHIAGNSNQSTNVPDYDYPDLRTQLLPFSGRIALPPRNWQRKGLMRTISTGSEYVAMNPAFDDNYINWETIRSSQADVPLKTKSRPPPVPQKPTRMRTRYSLDDMSVYMNLPVPEMTSPERKVEALPEASHHFPRPQPRRSPTESPSESPIESPAHRRKPRPVPRRRAKTTINPWEQDSATAIIPEERDTPPTHQHSSQTSHVSQASPFLAHQPSIDSPDLVTSSLPVTFSSAFQQGFLPPIPARRESNRRTSDEGKAPPPLVLPPRNIKRQTTPKVAQKYLQVLGDN